MRPCPRKPCSHVRPPFSNINQVSDADGRLRLSRATRQLDRLESSGCSVSQHQGVTRFHPVHDDQRRPSSHSDRVAAKVRRDLGVGGLPGRAGQHDLGSQCQGLRRRRPARPALQRGAFLRAQVDLDGWASSSGHASLRCWRTARTNAAQPREFPLREDFLSLQASRTLGITSGPESVVGIVARRDNFGNGSLLPKLSVRPRLFIEFVIPPPSSLLVAIVFAY
jgi:hypothetical protein